jgi:Ca2+-binding EF-hand superfamily protein
MRSYAKKLIRKFDRNNDGIISFDELCQGLKTMNIYLTADERDSLMRKLDINQDGEISDTELFEALRAVNL